MMKKIYSLVLLLLASVGFSQSVVITTVVDGTLSADGCTATTGGTSSPKIVELYVSGTVNFTGYKIETESNGGAPLAWSGPTLDALGTVTDSFVYLIYTQTGTTSPIFSEMYPAITANLLIGSNMPNGNGNDAYRVTDGTNVIDQYGDPTQVADSNDLSAPWAYQDSYAKRNNNVPANGGNFVASTFTYGGNQLFDAPNNTCTFISNAIGIGTYLRTPQNQINGLKVYPNPVTNGALYITTDNNDTKDVAIFDILGKQVVKATVTDAPVNVSALKTGVYVVKITEAGKTATRKLVVK